MIWQIVEATPWQEAGLAAINSSTETRSRLLTAISAGYRLNTLREGHDQQAIIASSVIDALAVHDSRESVCRALGIDQALVADHIFSGIAEDVAKRIRPVLNRKPAACPSTPEGLLYKLYNNYQAMVERREFPESPVNTALVRLAAPFVGKLATGKLLLQHASEEADASHQFVPVPALEKLLAEIAGKYHDWANSKGAPDSAVGRFLMSRLLGNPLERTPPLSYKGAIAAFWEAYGEGACQYAPDDLRRALAAEAQGFCEDSISLQPPQTDEAPAPRVRTATTKPRRRARVAEPPISEPADRTAPLLVADEQFPDDEAMPVEDAGDYEDPYAAEEVLKGVRTGDDTLGDYLRMAGQFELLTAEQEVGLCKAIEAGLFARDALAQGGYEGATPEELQELVRLGEVARDKMIHHNLRLVVTMARRHHRGGGHLSLIDVIQEGNKGLLKAVERFDYTQGFKFSTYATWWIRHGMTKAIKDLNKTIRLPLTAQEKISLIKNTQADLEKDLGRTPTLDEVAVAAGMEPAQVRYFLKVEQIPLSLDATVRSDSEELILSEAVGDKKAPDPYENVGRGDIAREFDQILGTLGPEDEGFIRWFLGTETGEPLTVPEAARALDTTSAQVVGRIRRIRTKLEDPALRSRFPDALAFLGKPKETRSAKRRRR